MKKTRMGKAMRAVAKDEDAAWLVGIDVRKVYLVTTGLGMGLIGIAWIIFGVWNAINDPIFGVLEERTRTKIGRRIPYIRYGSFFFGLFFILSWFPFFGASQTALFLNFIVVLFLE